MIWLCWSLFLSGILARYFKTVEIFHRRSLSFCDRKNVGCAHKVLFFLIARDILCRLTQCTCELWPRNENATVSISSSKQKPWMILKLSYLVRHSVMFCDRLKAVAVIKAFAILFSANGNFKFKTVACGFLKPSKHKFHAKHCGLTVRASRRGQ